MIRDTTEGQPQHDDEQRNPFPLNESPFTQELITQRDRLAGELEQLRDELLRDDEPVAWRVANIIGDHFSFETFYSGDEAESAAGFLGEYWGGTDKLYLRPAPKVPEGYVLVPKEPLVGINYEIGLWSRRNHEAMLEDQLAAAPKGEE
jgi:hypothetical protein